MSLGELIPASRLIDWQPGVNVGVIGGIPTSRATVDLIDVTQSPYNADNTGSTDTVTAIHAARDAAIADGSKKGIYLPAGTYRADSTIYLGPSFNGKTMRGAGWSTIIDSRVNQGIIVGTGNSVYTPVTPEIVASGVSKGSTTINVPGTSDWVIGEQLILQVENDDSIPVASTYAYDVFATQAPMRQMVRVVSKAGAGNGDDLTFFPPLHDNYSGLQVRLTSLIGTRTSGIGVEDLMVDSASYTGGPGGAFSGVFLQEAYGCWLKNVKTINQWNYSMGIGLCLNCEIRGCWAGELGGSGSNGAGLLFNAWNTLVEDSIFIDAFPVIEVNAGSQGNVFAYNYGNGMANTNHSPHNRFNLHEGNAWNYMMSDGYFGSESDLTILRNYLWGGTVNLRRFVRRVSVVGCIFSETSSPTLGTDGYPNIGNVSFSGTASLIGADPWRDWQMTGTLTTRTSATQGIVTLDSGKLNYDAGTLHRFSGIYDIGGGKEAQFLADISAASHPAATFTTTGETLPDVGTVLKIGPGSFFVPFPEDTGSFQERDLDVAATTIDKGNWYANGETYSSLGGDTVPNSLYLSAQPAFWTQTTGFAGTWPPYDATDPAGASVNDIPAGYRFTNNLEPGGGGGGGGGGSSSITTPLLNITGTLNVGG